MTLAPAVSDDDFCTEPRTLRVALRAAPTEPLLSAPLCLGAPEGGDEEVGEWIPNPIDVTVYSSPAGGRALDILRILDTRDCPACAERIRRIATHPDFASMAEDAELQRLVEASAQGAAP